MTLKIILKNVLLSLPINHHHILQGVFYSLMANDDEATKLHDEHSTYKHNAYKFFTFGQIAGHYQVINKTIIYDGQIVLEIRAMDENMLNTIANNARVRGVTFGDTIFTNVTCELSNDVIDVDECDIIMASPMCVYRTSDANCKKNTYCSNTDPLFYEEINNNFRRKYQAYFGKEPEGNIELTRRDSSPRSKYITWYKTTLVEAYRGRYTLKGRAEYLDFLYNVGLGVRNSQGFGMFRIE